MTYCYFGHHKCATTWFASVIPSVCQDLGLSWSSNSSMDDFSWQSPDASPDFILFRNAGPNHLPPDRPYRGFHMVRDPRDIVVSAVHSHRSSHPTEMWEDLKAMRETLKGMTFEEGLLWELDYLRPIFGQMAAWNYANPFVKEFKMEDFLAKPYRTALEVFRALDLLEDTPLGGAQRVQFAVKSMPNKVRRPIGHRGPRGPLQLGKIPAERLLGIVHANNFKRLSGGREPGKENTQSHFRKGVAGDWRGSFTPAVTAKFKTMYGDLLVKLGYETDLNWESDAADPAAIRPASDAPKIHQS